ncbi:MAG: ATP-dependent helicase [Anaerolineae bacterium]|nr:ATP-dependent helicase [Anaerolineae bacterium]
MGNSPDLSIDVLDLPTRAFNALMRAGIVTLADLRSCSDVDLLRMRGFGMTTLAQVRERLSAWERDHPLPPVGDETPAPAPPPPPFEPFALLPGRRVLHATWLSGALFLWGEGPPLPPRRGRAPKVPLHPFHLPPAALRETLPDLIPTEAGETRALAHLPAANRCPLPGPQLIRDAMDEPSDAPLELTPWYIDGLMLPPLAALTFLNDLPRPEDLAPRLTLGIDLIVWSLAAKLALELLARQQLAPTLTRRDGEFLALWVPVLDRPEDVQRVEMLAAALPTAARALRLAADDAPEDPPTPRVLLKDFLGSVVDAAVRGWAFNLTHVVTRRDNPAIQAWLAALFARSPAVKAPAHALEELRQAAARWLEQLLAGAEEPFRICFRLEPPEMDAGGDAVVAAPPADAWTLRFFLQARDDPSLLVPASLVWRERGATLRYLDRRFDNPQEKLLAALGQSARLFPPLQASLRQARPEFCALNIDQTYTFLSETAPLLEQSGFGVLVPQWWRKRHRRLGIHATISSDEQGSGILNLDALVTFKWKLALGDQMLAPDEFARLAELKVPLVQVRGEWVELRPEQVEAAMRFWQTQRAAEEEIALREALRMGLTEEGTLGDLPVVGIAAEGWVDELLQRLNGSAPLTELLPPDGLVGQLRPYQQRGLSWLAFLRQWGLGACLADDMGLGKTIQTIALFLHDREAGHSNGPVLVVCPTSVVGNWAREIARFAPSLQVMIHHGSDRLGGEAFLDAAAQIDVVISTYALARRDEEVLETVGWSGIVLDEAQNIKNPAAKQTQAIRRIASGYRIALTGTPVENRLSELWSIMQFLNPGYLGSQQAFRSQFALPIERYQDQEAAGQLRNLIQPFVLRRLKTDPTIIQDLPEKLENKVYCTLTPEQATLYQAVVQDALQQVEEAEGMQRKGLVLSMLTRLKQICNHPAHFLGDGSALADRSGKLARLGEMLEEVLAVDERALIFTQFAEMGGLLQQYLQDTFEGEVLFLHGGTPAKHRDRMITRFQEERHGPSLFVLSLKAGGLGLNLTRANHVFHFDRWWNPAVENQATDRAFRIGQRKDVWVHKFICAGSLEERIDALIESKKALAESVIGAGEGWLTELSTAQLRELVALSREAVGD